MATEPRFVFTPFACLVGLTLSGCFSTVQVPAASGPKLAVSAGAFPHEVLDALQKKYVDDQGRVDYKGLASDQDNLLRYLAALKEASPHSHPELFPSEADKLAYWINGYNAYVMFAVTQRPTMQSVNDVEANFFYFTKYEFGNEAISLFDVENEVVRKEFTEPRIHFALNCASAGCPELPPEAFMPSTLEAQLAREATEFCAHPDKVRVKDGKVEVSQIFEWYRDDFEADGGPAAFCKKWGRNDLPDGVEVTFIPYDWALNAQPGKAMFD